MKLRILAFLIVVCITFSLFGQSQHLRVYRVYVSQSQEIESLRQFDFVVVGTNFGKWVDLICTPESAKKMKEQLEKLKKKK